MNGKGERHDEETQHSLRGYETIKLQKVKKDRDKLKRIRRNTKEMNGKGERHDEETQPNPTQPKRR